MLQFVISGQQLENGLKSFRDLYGKLTRLTPSGSAAPPPKNEKEGCILNRGKFWKDVINPRTTNRTSFAVSKSHNLKSIIPRIANTPECATKTNLQMFHSQFWK